MAKRGRHKRDCKCGRCKPSKSWHTDWYDHRCEDCGKLMSKDYPCGWCEDKELTYCEVPIEDEIKFKEWATFKQREALSDADKYPRNDRRELIYGLFFALLCGGLLGPTLPGRKVAEE